jgi:hypothetical protein
LSPRKINSASLFSENFRAELRSAAHTARQAVRRPSRRTMALGTVITAGALVTVGAAAPWAASAATIAASAQGNSAAASGGGSATTVTASNRTAMAAQHQASAKPFTMYDSVSPTAVPSGQKLAAYADGTYQASWAQVAGHGKVVWIDVTGSNTGCDALDVEPGDATPAGAAAWVSAKLTKTPSSNAIVYTFKSDWGQVISNVNALPGWMHSHVKYWIADPTGSPHILPGSSATQWYWGANYDITQASPGFTD